LRDSLGDPTVLLIPQKVYFMCTRDTSAILRGIG